jgi:hypothetical protein
MQNAITTRALIHESKAAKNTINRQEITGPIIGMILKTPAIIESDKAYLTCILVRK